MDRAAEACSRRSTGRSVPQALASRPATLARRCRAALWLVFDREFEEARMSRVLTISRGTSVSPGGGGETASPQEVRAWFRGRSFLRHLFQYDEVRVRVQAIEAMPRPFATALATRALSRRSCVIQDDQGDTANVT